MQIRLSFKAVVGGPAGPAMAGPLFLLSLYFHYCLDSLYIQHIIVQNSLQTVYSDSQLRSMFEDC